MKLHVDEEEGDYSVVVSEGTGFSYICHNLGNKGVEFYAQHVEGQMYLIWVSKDCKHWLDHAVLALAARRLF